MQKTALKNNEYSKNEAFLKLHKKWPTCKGYSLCKITTLDQKLKLQTKCQKRLFNPVKLVLCKNGFKKQWIMEKLSNFESWEKWPICKGYSLCKITTLGQKLNCKKSAKNDSSTQLNLFYAKKTAFKNNE